MPYLTPPPAIAISKPLPESQSSSLFAQQVPIEKPQTAPNRDRFLQPIPLPTPLPPPNQIPVTPAPTTIPAPITTPAIAVKSIEVTGSTVFSKEEINTVTAPFASKTLTLEELRKVADSITQLYLNRQYLTSRAILVNQTIVDGVVQIRVIEGSLKSIEVQGLRRLKPNYIRDRIKLGGISPLNNAGIEERLRLLRTDPLIQNIEASLRAGNELGQSILTVRVTETKPFYGTVGIDNYSPPSIGSERIGLTLGDRDLTGIGDEIRASYYFTQQNGSDIFDFAYRVPVNAMNGTIQLRAAPNRTQIIEAPFNQFGFQGEQEFYEISFRQPLIRSLLEELALSVGFTLANGKTFVSDDTLNFFNVDNRTSVIKFGQDYVRRDVRGAWSLRSLFSVGTGLFDATSKPAPEADGRFFSWLGQAQRVQLLGKTQLLIVQADVQLTPDSLLPSQLFVLGGGQSVRGYRQNVRAGDNGFKLSVEDQIALQRNEAGIPVLQVAPFVDAGAVWNVTDNPNNDFLPSQRFLLGAGVGLIWEPFPRLNLRLDYAPLFVNFSDRGNNLQDDGFYFSASYRL
jgi:hemolysin activation/secretion protein